MGVPGGEPFCGRLGIAVDSVDYGQHLQFEQLGDQDGLFTFVALTAETQGPFKDVALLASSVADRALAAYAALVQGVSYQRAAPTELST